eukprot:TRINITY_DN11327_c0_g6_i1.p1 TRINITY_DN11327_c0_g6~~TRINITY_DN11327_c0_g6_i1.p1  ORF type:complete len:699 (-),score=109.77 TRINITY_DN11327_c0_g6_i1:173-2269(-)
MADAAPIEAKVAASSDLRALPATAWAPLYAKFPCAGPPWQFGEQRCGSATAAGDELPGTDAAAAAAAPEVPAAAAAAPAAAPVAPPPPPVPAKPEEDREEFTGLRLSKRDVDAERWRRAIRGHNPPRRVVPFERLGELKEVARRRLKVMCDCVVIGVLYEKPRSEKFANGELYMRWGLTDLATPRLRRVMVHIRWQAFKHWHKGKAAETAKRGAVFAVMNPTVLQESDSKGLSDYVLRVEKETQLLKLGESASLGLCDMKGCLQPVNRDYGDRFCAVHLSQAYADKRGRTAASGGVTLQGLIGVKSVGGRRPAPRQLPQGLPTEDDDEKPMTAQEKRQQDAEVRADVAMKLSDRRSLVDADANRSYTRSMTSGVGASERSEKNEWSRVPMLGRGLEDQDGMELDFDTLSTTEKLQTRRLVEMRKERHDDKCEDEQEVGGNSLGLAGIDAPPANASSTAASSSRKRPRCDELPESNTRRAAPTKLPAKRTLSDLLEAMETRRTARRTDAAAPKAATSSRSGAPATSSANKAATNQAKSSEVTPAARACAEKSLSDLSAAATGSCSRSIPVILKAVADLPDGIIREIVGQQLYTRIGHLALNASLDFETKRQVSALRRRWRVAEDSLRKADDGAKVVPATQSAQEASKPSVEHEEEAMFSDLVPAPMDAGADAVARVDDSTKEADKDMIAGDAVLLGAGA